MRQIPNNRASAGPWSAACNGKISNPMSEQTTARQVRHQNLYAHHLWQQQRFFAGLLLVVGVAASGLALYRGQLFSPGFAAWILYIPAGLALGGAVLFFRYRSHVKVEEGGVRISSLLSSVLIDYDSIKSAK